MIHLPLAPRTVRAAQTAHILRAVLPSFNGGLHCGYVDAAGMPANAEVLPPFNGGLHCGVVILWEGDVTGQCSRRSTAGSIAAGSSPTPTQCPVSLLPPFDGGLHCGTLVAQY